MVSCSMFRRSQRGPHNPPDCVHKGLFLIAWVGLTSPIFDILNGGLPLATRPLGQPDKCDPGHSAAVTWPLSFSPLGCVQLLVDGG